MKKIEYPDYIILASQMTQNELLASPAEIHGLISGLLAAGMPLKTKSWLEHVQEFFNDGSSLSASLTRQIGELVEVTYNALNDTHFSFNPLLPNDDTPLDERAEAMAQWVQNFVIGFALVCKEMTKAPEDIQELLGDFNHISQMSMDLDSEDESNEQAYVEVLEYLRVGAMACFNHFGLGSDTASPTLH